jgi:protein-disulfide isomerase
LDRVAQNVKHWRNLLNKLQKISELEYDMNKVTDYRQIMALGIMMKPALVVNGNVKVSGKVPSIPEIKQILKESMEQ